MDGSSLTEFLKELKAQVPDEPPWTDEEEAISTPYSDLVTWEQILEFQLKSGISRFKGPPGLLEKVVSRLSSTTGPETT